MEENNKVIIFEKKELIIVLTIVLVLIVTSFTLGIRLGKKLAFNESGITSHDVKEVELKSAVEEDAEATVSEDAKLSDEEKLKKLMLESKERLNDELSKFSNETAPTTAPETKSEVATKPKPAPKAEEGMTGKYTIQLGSYNSMDEAKQFAEGFTVRGYSPIINEVQISGKGNWYRVSLGLFDTVDEAKAYIKAEQSLFSGQDHIITEIK